MSLPEQAQSQLLSRLDAVEDALLQALLIDRVLTDVSHNSRAQVLRNGLMVVAFTALEDFIRARCGQLLRHVSRTSVRFDDLPSNLREAAVFDAMKAAYEQAKLVRRSGGDPFSVAQQAAADVASTSQGALSLSALSLAYGASNVSSGEIEKVLQCFQVSEPWPQLDAVARTVGLSGPPMKPRYEQAQRLRNEAAHSVTANIQPNDLQQFCTQAKALALSFDLLASHTAELLHIGDPAILQSRTKPAGSVTIVFVDETARGYSESKIGAKRATKVSPDLPTAWQGALARPSVMRNSLVARDRSKRPIKWRTPC